MTTILTNNFSSILYFILGIIALIMVYKLITRALIRSQFDSLGYYFRTSEGTEMIDQIIDKYVVERLRNFKIKEGQVSVKK